MKHALGLIVALVTIASQANGVEPFPVQLVAPRGAEPDVVCLMLEQARPGFALPAKALAIGLDQLTKPSGEPWIGVSAPTLIPRYDEPGYQDFAKNEAFERFATVLRPRRNAVWRAEQTRLTDGVNSALEALAFSPRTLASESCELNPEECRPSFEQGSPTQSVVCTMTAKENQSRERRLAVLELTTPGPGAVNLSELTLRGSLLIVSIHDVDNVLKPALIGLRVVGGHYQTEMTTYDVTPRGAVVSLRPRCRTQLLHIVPAKSELGQQEVDVEVGENLSHSAELVAQCKGRLDETDTFRVRMVEGSAGGSRSLRARLGTLEMVTQLRGDVVNNIIDLRARRLEFSWQKHCLHRRIQRNDECPSASLPKVTAGACKPQLIAGNHGGLACRYTCEGSRAFSLPTPVVFRVQGSDAGWSDSLEYANQELRSFVALDERELQVDLRHWRTDDTRSQDRIEYIELQGTFGGVHRVAPASDASMARVPYPALACGDQLTYQAYAGTVGGRNYAPSTLPPLENGVVVLSDPAVSAHVLALSASLGGGLSLGPFNVDVNFKPFLDAGLGVAWEPYDSWLGAEARLDWLIGHHPGYGISSDPPEPEYVWYYRVPLSAMLKARLSSGISIGLGGGIAPERAMKASEQQVSGGLNLVGHFFGLARVHLSTSSSLDVFGWVFPKERVVAFHTDFVDTASSTYSSYGTALVGLRLNVLLVSGRGSATEESDAESN